METACHLISAAAEFSACVENGIYNGSRRYSLLGVYANRDTTSVIGYFDNIVLKYLHVYFRTVACKGFINSIIDYFVNKVMKTSGAC